ncbi:shufflon system plasmid conjugative transfer pilus tip adhesin PilV [Pseudomonas sp. JG-B]|uniref:shufflon system plasmid conjugative transfer pilus tip adhesin PilV n=1 Tax=Pseudomonas sp. JG-B TaxID=2603214 RepID=UPI00129E3D68|nr:shufflon system plasmid conjugative transfer pilus tip adhesin PilV [Pseudomonas sp. JG-B]MRK19121.1 shufflon system plasmid conjugative transfer pilus tip adhesin PilV [Pseudomonas sp. JG-B]
MTILEAMIGLTVSALVAAGTASAWLFYLDHQANLQAGEHAKVVLDAGARYLKDNQAAVLAAATPTTPAVITVAMLLNTNYLPMGFSDQNSYGQTYSIRALEPQPNVLQTLLVTTGGQAISEQNIRAIARNIGAQGGFISTLDTATAQGALGGWQMPVASFGVNPGAGHLSAALFFEDGAIANDYLYRNPVAGRPELQTMNASINMNSNSLNNAASVNATAVNAGTVTASGNVTASGSVSAAGNVAATGNLFGTHAFVSGETSTGGYFRTTGNGGWYSERWNGGWVMTDAAWVRSYADKGVYTGGEMRAGKMTFFRPDGSRGVLTAQRRSH